jgi:transcriptional regulator with XRE-family HTH domain
MGRIAMPNYHGRQLVRALKQLRETAAGIHQQDVAEQAHFTVQKVSRIESGQVPGYHELQALLTIYNVPPDDWLPYLELWEQAKAPT